MYLSSLLQAKGCHRRSGDFSLVRLLVWWVRQSKMAMSVIGEVSGLDVMASLVPREKRALSSEIWGVLVRLSGSPPSLGTA